MADTLYMGSLIVDGEVKDSALLSQNQVDEIIDRAKFDSEFDGITVQSESLADGTLRIYRDVPCPEHGTHRQEMRFVPVVRL